jgi:hypothetical protein
MVTGAPRTSASLVWLGHPVTVLALVVLVVNDHILKAAHPGLLTGKLSDVAGLVLAPPLVAVLASLIAPRLRARTVAVGAVAAVGLTFTIIKSSGYAAGAASAAWSLLWPPSLVRADVTDMVALPALAVAWWAWTRSSSRPRTVPTRWVRAIRVGVLLPAALIGVAATSAASWPEAFTVSVRDGMLYAGTRDVGDDGDFRDDATSWRARTADGLSWTPVPDAEQSAVDADLIAASRVRKACSAARPQICFRVVPGRLGVEQSADAGSTWSPSWRIPDGQWRALSRAYPSVRSSEDHLSSASVAVLDTAAGLVVVVANGRDGFARRSASGTWERVGFPAVTQARDLPSPGAFNTSRRFFDVVIVLVLVVVLATSTFAVGAVGAAVRAGGGAVWWLFLLIPVLMTAWVMALLAIPSGELLALPVVALSSLIALGGATTAAAVPAAVVSRRRRHVRTARAGPRAGLGWAGRSTLGAVVTAVLSGLILAGWFPGVLLSTPTALGVTLLSTVPGLALALRTPPPEPAP